MSIPGFLVVTIVYAAVSAAGLALIKETPALLDQRTVAGAVLYGIGFGIWILMLRLFPLSIAFPVAAGSLVVATQLVARFYLAETVSVTQTAGVVLIVAGIALAFVRT